MDTPCASKAESVSWLSSRTALTTTGGQIPRQGHRRSRLSSILPAASGMGSPEDRPWAFPKTHPSGRPIQDNRCAPFARRCRGPVPSQSPIVPPKTSPTSDASRTSPTANSRPSGVSRAPRYGRCSAHPNSCSTCTMLVTLGAFTPNATAISLVDTHASPPPRSSPREYKAFKWSSRLVDRAMGQI